MDDRLAKAEEKIKEEEAKRLLEEHRRSNPAGDFYLSLRGQIEVAQKKLADDEDLAVRYYTSTGDVFLMESFDYHNPITFVMYGKDAEGNRTTVTAHIASVQLVLKSTKRRKDEPRRQFGFLSEDPKKE